MAVLGEDRSDGSVMYLMKPLPADDCIVFPKASFLFVEEPLPAAVLGKPGA